MRRQRSKSHAAATEPRPARRIYEEGAGSGTYRSRRKLADPTACPRCGAAYRAGRWTWRRAPETAPRALCPACRRIEAGDPDGYVEVRGAFARAHRSEILGLARNIEEREKQEHPLKRLMGTQEERGGLRIETTDRKLARSIGRALQRAYEGRLEQPRIDKENVLRVHWRRD